MVGENKENGFLNKSLRGEKTVIKYTMCSGFVSRLEN